MPLHPLAGKLAPQEILIQPEALVDAYFNLRVDQTRTSNQVSFGTSGHRGSALDGSFNECHILAITQAVCEYRKKAGIDGPLFLGIDTHALSIPALESTIEVLVANGVSVRTQHSRGFTPTPVISHAILRYNRGRDSGYADGVVITPSHNPPRDGGYKYNPPNGGPSGTDITEGIQKRANELLFELTRAAGSSASSVLRTSFKKAITSEYYEEIDFVVPYVEDLVSVVDMEAIRASGLRIGVDPMGGSNLAYWDPIAEKYGLKIEVVNRKIDPTFRFMTVDRDGKIRMDCSSPYAMAGLVGLKDQFDIAFGNDADSDRHGIVSPSVGLMNPNHYLAVAIEYLFSHRPKWKDSAAIGKTLVSSAMIDRVAKKLGRRLSEVPVGFKWFVDGLLDGSYGFGGEESAGASFLRRDGTVWTTDKDGIILGLLAAEITATTGKDPGLHYIDLTEAFGAPVYERIDAPADARSRAALSRLDSDSVSAPTLAGDPILQRLTKAPGNGAAIGGLKVVTKNGWFAARPSGTEDVYKIYTESFLGTAHLLKIQEEAKEIVSKAIAK